MRRLLEEHPEAVSGLQLALEIHLAGKDVRQLHRQLHLLAAGINRRDQRRVVGIDARIDGHHLDLLVVGQHLRFEHFRILVVATEDAEEAIGVDLVFELAQHSIERCGPADTRGRRAAVAD